MEGLNSSIIKELQIIKPPIEEQRIILEHLNKTLDEFHKIISIETRRIELLKEYRQALISDVVTGKIDVREEV
jgi:type I restriction enzyme S subunit